MDEDRTSYGGPLGAGAAVGPAVTTPGGSIAEKNPEKKSGRRRWKDNRVYNVGTLESLKALPRHERKLAAQGYAYTHIEERGKSKEFVAQKLGVSKRMVTTYVEHEKAFRQAKEQRKQDRVRVAEAREERKAQRQGRVYLKAATETPELVVAGRDTVEDERGRLRRVLDLGLGGAEMDLPALRAHAIERIEADALFWLQNFTKTKNPHWKREKFEGPYQAFPSTSRYPFLPFLFEQFRNQDEPVILVKKSRDMMLSWDVVGFYTHMAMTGQEQEVLFQSETDPKAEELIDYAACLWDQQEEWLKERFPLVKSLDKQRKDTLEFANGSALRSIPQGGNKVRSFHPTEFMGDEVSFQPEAGESYDTVQACAQKVIQVSSAGPGWFEDFTEGDLANDPATVDVMRGVKTWRTKNGLLVIWLHYSAIPERDPLLNPKWAKRERKRYSSQARWDQEQEIQASAGGGERVFAEVMDAKRGLIVIDDPNYQPSPYWNYFGGFDYGKTNPTSFHIYCIDDDGDIVALGEHYQGGNLEPSSHAAIMREMFYFKRVSVIWCDPRIFDLVQAQRTGGYESTAQLFGIKIMRPGTRGESLMIGKVQEMWKESPPRLKICCPRGISWEKKQEGTFNFGCPNLLWELYNARFEEATAAQLLNKNAPEGIAQKNNHALDDLTYALNSEPTVSKPTKDVQWAKALKARRDAGKPMDINTLAMLWKREQAQREQAGGIQWR